jgi:hypothetical protein
LEKNPRLLLLSVLTEIISEKKVGKKKMSRKTAKTGRR